jgi:hypothetical protein
MEIKHKFAFWFGIVMLFGGYASPLGILLILYGLGVFDNDRRKTPNTAS